MSDSLFRRHSRNAVSVSLCGHLRTIDPASLISPLILRHHSLLWITPVVLLPSFGAHTPIHRLHDNPTCTIYSLTQGTSRPIPSSSSLLRDAQQATRQLLLPHLRCRDSVDNSRRAPRGDCILPVKYAYCPGPVVKSSSSSRRNDVDMLPMLRLSWILGVR